MKRAAAAPKASTAGWRCPSCQRRFTRPNQRHACGTGDRDQVLRNRPPAVVQVYRDLEAFARKLGAIEIVARDRYVLLRSARIFTDLVILTDAVRAAIHLGRQVQSPLFIKVVADRRQVTHVARLQSRTDVEAVKPLIKEAYEFSLRGR